MAKAVSLYGTDVAALRPGHYTSLRAGTIPVNPLSKCRFRTGATTCQDQRCLPKLSSINSLGANRGRKTDRIPAKHFRGKGIAICVSDDAARIQETQTMQERIGRPHEGFLGPKQRRRDPGTVCGRAGAGQVIDGPALGGAGRTDRLLRNVRAMQLGKTSTVGHAAAPALAPKTSGRS